MDVSQRRVGGVLNVPRSAVREREGGQQAVAPRSARSWPARVKRLIEIHPTYGYRPLWALLRFSEGLPLNRKAVYRVLTLKGWSVSQRRRTPRPPCRGAAVVPSEARSAGRWTTPTSTAGETAGPTWPP
jgi:putative transposase